MLDGAQTAQQAKEKEKERQQKLKEIIASRPGLPHEQWEQVSGVFLVYCLQDSIAYVSSSFHSIRMLSSDMLWPPQRPLSILSALSFCVRTRFLLLYNSQTYHCSLHVRQDDNTIWLILLTCVDGYA